MSNCYEVGQNNTKHHNSRIVAVSRCGHGIVAVSRCDHGIVPVSRCVHGIVPV